VLDVRLPGKSGLDFQQELNAANINLPIVFLTGHGDIPMSVRAMKAGAVEFLTKPFREQDLLDAVQTALERDRVKREDDKLSSMRIVAGNANYGRFSDMPGGRQEATSPVCGDRAPGDGVRAAVGLRSPAGLAGFVRLPQRAA
jgi:DNA-binding NtrC family response regulator